MNTRQPKGICKRFSNKPITIKKLRPMPILIRFLSRKFSLSFAKNDVIRPNIKLIKKNTMMLNMYILFIV